MVRHLLLSLPFFLCQLHFGYGNHPHDDPWRVVTTTPGAEYQNESTADQILRLVIGDATVLRQKRFQPNVSSSCIWPQCAPHCVPCAKTNKYWLCLSSPCQENSECVLANCYAKPGYCYADAYPQKARCFLGGQPPKQPYRHSLILRLTMAPPVPVPTASWQEWYQWGIDCSVVPVVLILFGVFVAGRTWRSLINETGRKSRFLPQSTRVLVGMFIICFAFMIIAQIFRMLEVSNVYDLITEELHDLKGSLSDYKNLTAALQKEIREYNTSLRFVASTCDANPVGEKIVTSLALTLSQEFQQVSMILDVADNSIDASKKLLSMAKHRYIIPFFETALWAPAVPPLIVIGLMVPVLLIHRECPCLHHGLRYVAPFVAFFVILLNTVASILLYSSAVIAGYCLHIDENLIEASHQADFNSLVQEKYDVDGFLQHLAGYYISGTHVNPLASLLQNVQSVLYTIVNLYDRYQWVVSMVTSSCSGVEELHPSDIVHVLLDSVDKSMTFIEAGNLWPFYDSIIHSILCKSSPPSLFLAWAMTASLSLLLLPLLAISAGNHLKRLGNSGKSVANFEDLTSDSDEDGLKERIFQVGSHISAELDQFDAREQAILLDNIIVSRAPQVSRELSEIQAGSSNVR